MIKKINISAPIYFDEPMASHTTFNIGGPAEIFIQPQTKEELKTLFSFCRNHEYPWFILGKGSNILVSDKGVKGIVIDVESINAINASGTVIHADAGAEVNRVCEYAANLGLAGMEFLYALPGSIGGALWMNARCFDKSISEIIKSVEVIDTDGLLKQLDRKILEFDYKTSPFQHKEMLILSANFKLQTGNKKSIKSRMAAHKEERIAKGHFHLPCAGSIFKNNRAFGKPAGAIIDSLSLKGLSIGGAKVSDLHANFIVNTGSAKAAEVRELINLIKDKVKNAYGFVLEEEILYAGDWS
ncbi:MAG: UDP-N-acetylmuramate dehydrogenase [Spirochaetales bacterium]|nr:UDP-N-acetylmuramate dehydrogenase [Spirochaetales bacterium]